jgi:hypothetical protein
MPPDTHSPTKKPLSWLDAEFDDRVSDDEPLPETPDEIVRILGFDPLEDE